MTTFKDEMSLKIPAYLRGDLSDTERQELESYAAENPEFSADIEFQKQLKSAIKDSHDGFVPGEMGWARLSKAMKAESSDLSSSGHNDQIVANDMVDDKSKAPKFWRYAAAILAVAVIGQAGAIGFISSGDKSEPQYVTVSELARGDNTVKIAFNKSVTIGELTKEMSDLGGVIVSGPSALGLYAISFETSKTCLKAVEALEANTAMVETISRCN